MPTGQLRAAASSHLRGGRVHAPALSSSRRSAAARLVAYDVFLLASCVIGGIAALFLHEALGHCATAWLVGAKVDGITLSVMGGGQASYRFAIEPGPLRRAIPLAGGIALSVAVGIAVLLQAKRARMPLRLGLLCFGALALTTDIGYAAYGLYHGWGDPGEVAELLGVPHSVLVLHESALWIPFALLLVPAAALAMRQYLVVQEEVFPSASRAARLWRTSLTIGVLVVGVMGLQMTIGRTTSPVERKDERSEVIRGRRIVAALKEVRSTMAGSPEHEIQKEINVRIARIVAAPVDLPSELPLEWILLSLVVLSGIATTLLARPRPSQAGADVSARAAAMAMALAITLSIVIMLKQGHFP